MLIQAFTDGSCLGNGEDNAVGGYGAVLSFVFQGEVRRKEVSGSITNTTNNRAERAIRPCVIARKVSGGSRSDRGTHIYSVLMSVVQTLDQNGKNIVTHGQEIIQSSHG